MNSRIALTVLALVLSASAHATRSSTPTPPPSDPGTGKSGALTWEQLRFYGPAGGVTSTYTGGQPTSSGEVVSGALGSTDLCSDADVCGTKLKFTSLLGGNVYATATTTAAGTAVVRQDLSPNYGGLGVQGYTPASTSKQWVWKSDVKSYQKTTSNMISRYGSLKDVTKPAAWAGGDEINHGDTLTLTFEKTVRVLGFHFFDENHQQADLSGNKFGLSVNGVPVSLSKTSFSGGYPFNEYSTLIGNTFTFSYASSKGDDYYLGAIKFASFVATPVPEPASTALMLAGLAMVGGALRRRHGNLAATT